MANNEALRAIAATNSAFSRDFYKAVGGNEGNLVASPLSAQLVLALAHLGARGETGTEMAKALCLPEDQTLANQGFLALVSTLKSKDKIILEIANKMYVKHDFQLQPEFVKAANEIFNTTVDKVDFLASETLSQINNWVEKATHDKIKDLIPEGIFDELTRLVLINAVYFKGPWLNPFNPSHTQPRDFYLDAENKVETPFMYKKAHYGYAKLDDLNAQLVELPYEGRELSLVIILPDSRTGLADLEKKLESVELGSLMQKVGNRELELYLPKFKLEVSLNLNEPLKKMGMERMFSNGADFSGISTSEQLQVSDVLQKTFIEVSEEGTEAASATGMIMATRMMLAPPPRINVDHPFLFFLALTKPSVNLFSGRLLNPQN